MHFRLLLLTGTLWAGLAGDTLAETSQSVSDEDSLLRVARLLQFGGKKQSDRLQKLLPHPHPEVRRRALWACQRARCLSDMALSSGLHDSDPKVRLAAVRVLQAETVLAHALKINGRDQAQWIPRLVHMLRSDSAPVQAECAKYFADRGNEDADVIAALVSTAQAEQDASAAAIAALASMNSDTSLGLVRIANQATRRRLPELIQSTFPTPAVIRIWQCLMCDPDAEIRLACLKHVPRRVEYTDILLKAVIRQWFDSDQRIQAEAVAAFQEFILGSRDDLATTLDALVLIDWDWSNRRTVWRHLSRTIDRDAAWVVRTLQDPNQDLRRRMELAGVVSQCSGLSDDSVDVDLLQRLVVDCAHDTRSPLPIRVGIAAGLATDAFFLPSELQARLRRRLASVFAEALETDTPLPFRMMALPEIAYERFDDPAAAEVIMDAFERDFHVITDRTASRPARSEGRWRAALLNIALYIQSEPTRRHHALVTALSDVDAAVRRTASEHLRDDYVSAESRIAPDVVIRMLSDSDAGVRSFGLQCLPFAAMPANDAWQLTFARLDDSDRSVRDRAVSALIQLGGDMTPAVSRLLDEMVQLEQSEGWKRHGSWHSNRERLLQRLIALDPEHPKVQAAVVRTFHREDTRLIGLRLLSGLSDQIPAVGTEVSELLHEPYPELRSAAADTLIHFEDAAREVLPRLEQLLADKEKSIRVASARAVLTQNPDHVAAGRIFAATIAEEVTGMWCYSSPPAITCTRFTRPAKGSRTSRPAIQGNLSAATPNRGADRSRQIQVSEAAPGRSTTLIDPWTLPGRLPTIQWRCSCPGRPSAI